MVQTHIFGIQIDISSSELKPKLFAIIYPIHLFTSEREFHHLPLKGSALMIGGRVSFAILLLQILNKVRAHL